MRLTPFTRIGHPGRSMDFQNTSDAEETVRSSISGIDLVKSGPSVMKWACVVKAKDEEKAHGPPWMNSGVTASRKEALVFHHRSRAFPPP